MHFQIPDQPIRSLKAFVSQYLMIVLSILTALGLEESVMRRHHQESANVAQEEIESELRENITEVRNAHQMNSIRLNNMTALASDLIREINAGTPAPLIKARVLPSRDRMNNIGISTPQLRREAWDTAIANQSASYISTPLLRRYAALYALLRDLASNEVQIIGIEVNGSHMRDAITDMEIDDFSPREILRGLGQMMGALKEVQERLEEIESKLQAALPGPVESAPASSIPSAAAAL